jgi:hypothetical protein
VGEAGKNVAFAARPLGFSTAFMPFFKDLQDGRNCRRTKERGPEGGLAD